MHDDSTKVRLVLERPAAGQEGHPRRRACLARCAVVAMSFRTDDRVFCGVDVGSLWAQASPAAAAQGFGVGCADRLLHADGARARSFALADGATQAANGRPACSLLPS